MDLRDELREAFEEHGYEVTSVTENRDRLSVSVREEDAGAADLRAIVHDVVGEGKALGLNVTTESLEGVDAVGTVVSFRTRA